MCICHNLIQFVVLFDVDGWPAVIQKMKKWCQLHVKFMATGENHCRIFGQHTFFAACAVGITLAPVWSFTFWVQQAFWTWFGVKWASNFKLFAANCSELHIYRSQAADCARVFRALLHSTSFIEARIKVRTACSNSNICSTLRRIRQFSLLQQDLRRYCTLYIIEIFSG